MSSKPDAGSLPRFLRGRDQHGSTPGDFRPSLAGRLLALPPPTPLFVQVVEVEQDFPHVPLVRRERPVHFVRRDGRRLAPEKVLDDLLGQPEAGRRTEQVRQPDGLVRRHDQPKTSPTTEPP